MLYFCALHARNCVAVIACFVCQTTKQNSLKFGVGSLDCKNCSEILIYISPLHAPLFVMLKLLQKRLLVQTEVRACSKLTYYEVVNLAATRYTRIWEVLDSNLGRDTGCPGFPQSLEASTGDFILLRYAHHRVSRPTARQTVCCLATDGARAQFCRCCRP